MQTITAELLWQIHRNALGGVSGATGAALPEQLDDVKFAAVKQSHWGMALALSRLTERKDPPLPHGMTEGERDEVLRRLDEKGFLPWSKSA